MTHPRTPRPNTRPSAYTPVPAMARATSTSTVYARCNGARYPARAGRLNDADCQLNASGRPSALEGFHNGRYPWWTWVHPSDVHGIISLIWSNVWRLWMTTPG